MSPRMAGSSDSKGTAAGMEAAVGEVDRLQVKESRGAVELSPPSASSCRRFCEDCEEHLRSGPRLPDHRKLRADEVLPNDTCRDENGDQDSGRGGSGSERFDGEFARTTLWANAGLEACSCTSKDKGEGGGCPSVADSKTVNLPSQETVSDSNIESQRDSMSLRTLVVEFGMEWKRRMAVRWRRVPYSVHLLFFTAGGIIGLVAALFYLAASRAEHVQVSYYKTTPWAMWLALPFGLPAILAVTRMFFDGCAGSGIPLEMWGMNVVDSPQMARVLSLRIAAGKFVLTVAGLLIGASTGREGPTVQISSSIFHEMIRLTRRFGIRPFSSFFDGTTLAGNHRYGEYLRISILVGGAAGIAGAFNTPLGGMIFAIEEMGHVFSRSLGHIMFCNVTVSAAVSIAIVGFYQWYGSYSDSLTAMQYLTVVPTVGILGGLLGGLWSLVLLAGVRLKQAKQLTMLPSPYILALLCGCGVVLTGWFTGGETYGSGYSASAAIISPSSTEEEAQPTVLFGPLKMVATWLSYWSGIPGGVFAPNISTGAGLGRLFYKSFLVKIDTSLEEPPVAVLTAVAYFAGVTQSPATSFAILLGMIQCRSSIVVAMMACSFLGWGASRLICPVPLYAALAEEALKPLPPESCQPSLKKLAASSSPGTAKNGKPSPEELERHLSYI